MDLTRSLQLYSHFFSNCLNVEATIQNLRFSSNTTIQAVLGRNVVLVCFIVNESMCRTVNKF